MTELEEQAWGLYCRISDGYMSARDFWEDLPTDIQERYKQQILKRRNENMKSPANAVYCVGDIVMRTKAGGKYAAGYQFVVHGIEIDRESSSFGYLIDKYGSRHNPAFIRIYKYASPDKRLKPGDTIEVSNTNTPGSWISRQFVMKTGDRYLCKIKDTETDHHYYAYEYGRSIKKSYTITLEDGKKVEISAESYQSIVNAVAKGD